MQLAQPQPGDLLEITVVIPAGSNPPGTVVSLVGITFVHATAGTFYPIVTSAVADLLGAVTIPATSGRFGQAFNAVLPGDAINIYGSGILLVAVTVGTVAFSPYTTYARQLAQILGTAYQAIDGSVIAEDLRTLGKALSDSNDTLTRMVNEAFPDSASDTLPDWESRLGAPSDTTLSTTQRQTNLLAKYRAARGTSPQRINAAIQTIDPSVVVLEWTIAQVYANEPNKYIWALAGGTQRLVFQFNIQVSPALYGAGGTTIAAGSNGAALPTGTINLVDASVGGTGFSTTGGTAFVTTSAGVQSVSYTGTTGTTLTGCTGGTGTMSTGGLVTWSAPNVNLARIQAIASQMMPAHTRFVVVVKTSGFRFDDANSLFDRDAFGG